MRKSNQEITDKTIIEDILKGSVICRLAMADGDIPYILPFNYGYQHNCIYIHSAPAGKKIDLLKKNNKVCFEIEQQADIVKEEKACKWATTYRSVVGYGHVKILKDINEKKTGLKIIMKHNGFTGKIEFDEKEVKSLVILKLFILETSGKQSGNWNKSAELTGYNLESERLILKEFTWDDLGNIHRLHSSPDVDRYNTLGIPKSINDTKEVLRSVIEDKRNHIRKKISWSLFLKQTGEFIGEAGISLSANRFKLGEIYYNLLPGFWGAGYGTETARTLVNFGFSRLGLHKVEAGVATENTSSVKVLEKAGMTREGLRRKILPIRGEWKDNYHYAIVEDDSRDY